MITIELNEHSAEDVKLIQELQKAGVPDDLIQKAYDAGLRNQAEWICLEQVIGLYECSKCGHRILRAKCNYCPSCGRKMKGANDVRKEI